MTLAPEVAESAAALLTALRAAPRPLEAIADSLRQAGLEPVLVEREPGCASLVARHKGTASAGGPLLLACHAAPPSDPPGRWFWDEAPDPLAHVADCVTVLLQLARRDPRPSRDFILVATADSRGLAHLVETHPDLVRAEWALTPGGGFTLSYRDRRLYPLLVATKGAFRIRLETKCPASPSVPRPDTAAMRLGRAVLRLGNMALPVHPSTPATRMLDAIGGLSTRLLKSPTLADFALQSVVDDSEVALSLGALVRNTATVTRLSSPQADTCAAIVEARLVPGQTRESLLEELDLVIDDDEVTVTVESEVPTFEAPVGTALYEKLTATLREADPAGQPIPWLGAGPTEAALLSKVGATSYGFAPALLPAKVEPGATPVFESGLGVLWDVVSGFCA